MRKYFTCIIVSLLFIQPGHAQKLEEESRQAIETFISCIKNNNVAKLKTMVNYPLRREYPLPDIKNEEEFATHYDEIFDSKLKETIATSDITTNWTSGANGLFFKQSIIWLDKKGNISRINYQSDIEKDKRNELIQESKEILHESIKEVGEPLYLFTTNTYKIRIDLLAKSKYRYTAWKKDVSMNNKPDIVLTKSTCISEGTAGRQYFEFINGSYKYECMINPIDTSNPIKTKLTVFHKNKEIKSEYGQLIRK